MPFVAVIPHQDCILQAAKKYCKLERNVYFFFQVATGKKRLINFRYINIMRKYQDRHNIQSKLKLLDLLHQIQGWRWDNVLDPLIWGWQLTKQGITPIKMIKQVVPPELFKIIKCGCKTDCIRKTAHADNMELFVLTFARVTGECHA